MWGFALSRMHFHSFFNLLLIRQWIIFITHIGCEELHHFICNQETHICTYIALSKRIYCIYVVGRARGRGRGGIGQQRTGTWAGTQRK